MSQRKRRNVMGVDLPLDCREALSDFADKLGSTRVEVLTRLVRLWAQQSPQTRAEMLGMVPEPGKVRVVIEKK